MMTASAGISPRNVPLQLLDGLCLAGDDPADEVANRHYAHDHVVLDHGKMTKTLVRHNGHAFVHRILRSNEDHWAGHDLPHKHLLRGVPFEDHFAGIVALRQYADQPVVGYHKQCADALHRHLLNGLVDGLLGRYRQDPIAALALQHRFNCVSDFHEAPAIAYTPILPLRKAPAQAEAFSQTTL